ncbi:hypothetical protein [Colwellia sp. UCD-KL20]|uniref:hypothetical protein n=1 Tax=Colwellia sp. UCD-KL20 TaxID=1917165 RepID=UPI000970DDDB|nr:hypothetical protein [Colwellia sp. UCD-KL20]
MKNYFSRLFSIGTYFNISYIFNIKEGLCRLTDIAGKRKRVNICLLERDSYWLAERRYNNINIIDLPKLIKAEIATIAPFPGRVFWSVKKLNSSQAIVVYIVVPIKYIEEIIGKCHFVYPKDYNFSSLSSNAQNLDPSSNLALDLPIVQVEANTSFTEDFKKTNIFNLAGFYLFKNKDKINTKQKVSFKQLALIICASVTLFTVVSSVYLSFNLSYVESQIAENSSAVEQALKTQSELKVKFESKKEFEAFSKENKNVLAIFSHLNFKDEKYRIERLELHPKGFKITGTSETSATNLLSILLNSPGISEAKFDRAVSKNRSGEDVFVIEVTFS